ncbi:MAG: vWA domain-containing protein [Gammaproteobacteria bacterium]
MIAFSNPMLLWLLLLAVIPLLRHGQTEITYSSLSMLPPDGLSDAADWLIRGITAAVIGALVLGLAGLHRAEEQIERIGQGAEMVVLMDSSGSMDRLFASGNENRGRAAVWGTYTSKGQMARQLLARFAGDRPQDTFAMFAFSGNPITVLPLTTKPELIQSAIAAGSIERGLGTTDLAAGLIRAFEFFKDRPFTGSRIVMLVSDGTAALTIEMQDRVKYLMEKYRVTLYWIYLRTKFSPGLHTELEEETAQAIAPEQIVHRFFTETGLPYRAFSAEDPDALQNAMNEVDKLQKLPIRYQDVIPRRDLSHWCFGAALTLLLLAFGAKLTEVRQWR